MPHTFQECLVSDILQVSDRVKIFSIQFPGPEHFVFKPGQFVMLNLPIDSKYHNRAYSIASAPGSDNTIQLVISFKPHGKGTQYLWEHVRIGDKLNVSVNALGKYSLPESIDRELCFISTGTGIAPLRSMILDLFARQQTHNKITLIYGNRFEQDILFRTEFEKLETDKPEFKFIPVLSRDNPGWTGRKGYVHPVYEELFSDNRPAYFYICGWKEMIKESKDRLMKMGYEKQYIRFESYD